jgi:hypothetical protein
MRNTHKIFVEKPEEKKQLGTTRRRWKYNIQIYLKTIGCEHMDYMNLSQGGEK